jgi:hypothetical protein
MEPTTPPLLNSASKNSDRNEYSERSGKKLQAIARVVPACSARSACPGDCRRQASLLAHGVRTNGKFLPEQLASFARNLA